MINEAKEDDFGDVNCFSVSVYPEIILKTGKTERERE
jgi:hypothetical protein